MRRYYCFCLILLILFSCEKVLEFDSSETESKLVLNGFPNPNEPVQVEVSKSRFFLDNDDTDWRISGAQVALWRNGEMINTLRESEERRGLYLCDYYPKEGETLQITASAERLDPVEATVEIPYAVPIISVDTIAVRNNDWDYYEDENNFHINYDVHVRFKDEGGVADYYRIYPVLEIVFENGVVERDYMWFEKDDPVFGEMDIFDISENEYGEFNDILFDGKEYTLKINCEHYVYGSGYYYENVESVTLIIELHHISEGFYHYLRSRTAASSAEDFGGLFIEPVQIYTNIKGGIGILGGYAIGSYQLSVNSKQ